MPSSRRGTIGQPQPAPVAVADQIEGSILDAGCGTNYHARFFAARGHVVYGVDFVPEAIARAKAKAAASHLEACFLVMDALCSASSRGSSTTSSTADCFTCSPITIADCMSMRSARCSGRVADCGCSVSANTSRPGQVRVAYRGRTCVTLLPPVGRSSRLTKCGWKPLPHVPPGRFLGRRPPRLSTAGPPHACAAEVGRGRLMKGEPKRDQHATAD